MSEQFTRYDIMVVYKVCPDPINTCVPPMPHDNYILNFAKEHMLQEDFKHLAIHRDNQSSTPPITKNHLQILASYT